MYMWVTRQFQNRGHFNNWFLIGCRDDLAAVDIRVLGYSGYLIESCSGGSGTDMKPYMCRTQWLQGLNVDDCNRLMVA